MIAEPPRPGRYRVRVIDRPDMEIDSYADYTGATEITVEGERLRFVDLEPGGEGQLDTLVFEPVPDED